MKKIINNRKFDTETARAIGNQEYGLPTDFDYTCETLYRKRTGEYFLHGEGGPRTCYARSCGGGSFGYGEAIIPLSYIEAQKWASECLDVDTYEAEFGIVSEGSEDSGVISARVSIAAKKALERAAAERGITQAQALEDILLSALKEG